MKKVDKFEYIKTKEDFVDYVEDIVYERDIFSDADCIVIEESLKRLNIKDELIDTLLCIIDDEIHCKNSLSCETRNKIEEIIK